MRAYLMARPDPAGTLNAARASGADALILDLAGTDGRAWIPSLTHAGRPRLILRVGAVDAPEIGDALSAAMAFEPDAIALPVAHGRDIAHLGARLAVHEAEGDRPDGVTRIVALVADAAGALNAATLVGASPRLAGIGWDARAVADELHARSLDESGTWSALLAQVRSLIRLAAAAAGVEAIEAAYPGEAGGFAGHLAAARRDGFGAALATSPAQIPLIRDA